MTESVAGTRIRVQRVLFAILLVSFAGCSEDSGPVAKEEPSVPASGVLTYRGKPLKHHRVVLMPEDGRRPATGLTDAEGKFVLGTDEPGDGAPPGRSKVSVVWEGPESAGEAVDQSAIDDPAKMPRPDVVIPAKYNDPATSNLSAEISESGTSDLKIDLQ